MADKKHAASADGSEVSPRKRPRISVESSGRKPVALLTGALGGIGSATAAVLRESGYEVSSVQRHCCFLLLVSSIRTAYGAGQRNRCRAMRIPVHQTEPETCIHRQRVPLVFLVGFCSARSVRQPAALSPKLLRPPAKQHTPINTLVAPDPQAKSAISYFPPNHACGLTGLCVRTHPVHPPPACSPVRSPGSMEKRLFSSPLSSHPRFLQQVQPTTRCPPARPSCPTPPSRADHRLKPPDATTNSTQSTVIIIHCHSLCAVVSPRPPKRPCHSSLFSNPWIHLIQSPTPKVCCASATAATAQ